MIFVVIFTGFFTVFGHYLLLFIAKRYYSAITLAIDLYDNPTYYRLAINMLNCYGLIPSSPSPIKILIPKNQDKTKEYCYYNSIF